MATRKTKKELEERIEFLEGQINALRDEREAAQLETERYRNALYVVCQAIDRERTRQDTDPHTGKPFEYIAFNALPTIRHIGERLEVAENPVLRKVAVFLSCRGATNYRRISEGWPHDNHGGDLDTVLARCKAYEPQALRAHWEPGSASDDPDEQIDAAFTPTRHRHRPAILGRTVVYTTKGRWYEVPDYTFHRWSHRVTYYPSSSPGGGGLKRIEGKALEKYLETIQRDRRHTRRQQEEERQAQ